MFCYLKAMLHATQPRSALRTPQATRPHSANPLFAPLMHPLGDVGFVFAHTALLPGQAPQPYAVAAIRLTPNGKRSEYTSLIHVEQTRARDYMHSHISRRMLVNAPGADAVRDELCAFLAGLECVCCFDPYDSPQALDTLLQDTRIFDLGFAADFFMPWAVSSSTRQLWETVHGRAREKVSFSAEEGVALCVDFAKYLFGDVLSDTRFPGVRALREYLGRSDTLFGDVCCHLLRHFSEYFGSGLLTPVSGEDTADWQQFLEEALPDAKLLSTRKQRSPRDAAESQNQARPLRQTATGATLADISTDSPGAETGVTVAVTGTVAGLPARAGDTGAMGATQPFSPLPEEGMRELFGQLAHSQRGYRVREAQITYAKHVARALNTTAVACIEAGTGTGKTLGYLLPVMEFLKRNPSQRVAVATYTKSLQNQLYGNEIATCRKLFGQYRDIPVALVKGKSNYVCARKLDDAYSPGLTGADLLTWLFFVNICYRHRQADCEDISPRLRRRLDTRRQLTALMLEVSAGSGCHTSHTRCPAQVVTAEAARARLVVTNHNKLILMEKDGKLNGLFRHCIIDEANHFEDAVRNAVSPEFSTADLFGQLRYLQEQCRRVVASNASEREKEHADEALDAMDALVRQLGDLRERFLQMDRGTLGGAVSLHAAHKAFSEGHARTDLTRLQALLEAVLERTALFTGKQAARLGLTYRQLSRCRTMRTLMHEALFTLSQIRAGLEAQGTWQAVQVFPRGWVLSGGHIYVGPLVRNHILSRRDAVIFTSATLTHQSSFDPFRRSIGLGKGPQVVFDSEELPPKPCFVTRVAAPFVPDVSLVVPSGTPSAVFEHKTAWLAHVAREIPRLIESNRGATLVLCASYDDLDALRERLEREYDGEYPLLFQKKGESPAALCDEFRAAKESVLFGVETFWHGVDFPGDTLTQVIITRLPFPSPSSPLMEARRRFLSEAAYWERHRYETAIKFRQGMGRLIRRETDSGIVVVLDSRLLANRWLAPGRPSRIVEGLENLPERHRRGRGV